MFPYICADAPTKLFSCENPPESAFSTNWVLEPSKDMQMNRYNKQNLFCLELKRWTCFKWWFARRAIIANAIMVSGKTFKKGTKWQNCVFFLPYYIVSRGRVLNLVIKEKCPGKGASSQPTTFSFEIQKAWFFLCLFCVCHCRCFYLVFFFVIVFSLVRKRCL